MILENLPLARLRFHLQTRHPCDVPPYKGDLLRMALLWWLSEFWCPMPERCRHGCQHPEVCMFGRLNEPPVDPAWPAKVRYLIGRSAPPAYALWDLQDRRQFLAKGARWAFEMTLVGDLAIGQIPAIVAAVQQGAAKGMGRVRLKSQVCRVVALGPGEVEHVLADEQPCEGKRMLTWHDYRPEQIAVGYAQGAAWAKEYGAPKDGVAVYGEPVHALALQHLSPVQIRERKQDVEIPHFRPWARALVRRLRILSVVHGAGEWPQAEYGPLLDLAETVRLEHDETFWNGYTRTSQRSGTREIEGFMGQAWYASEADLRPLLPILWLGQWLHVGKGYVLGNGRYRIEAVFR